MRLRILPEDIAGPLVVDFRLGPLLVGVIGPDGAPQVRKQREADDEGNKEEGGRGKPAAERSAANMGEGLLESSMQFALRCCHAVEGWGPCSGPGQRSLGLEGWRLGNWRLGNWRVGDRGRCNGRLGDRGRCNWRLGDRGRCNWRLGDRGWCNWRLGDRRLGDRGLGDRGRGDRG